MNPANFKGQVIVMVFAWSRGIDPAQSQHYSCLFQSKANYALTLAKNCSLKLLCCFKKEITS